MTAQILDFQTQKAKVPTPVNGNVPPKRVANSVRRPREHLSPHEVESLIEAARKVGRHKHRDGTMILIAYRHGLRVSELIALSWSQVDLKQGVLHVTRSKNGTPSTHPLRGPEIRALRRLKREYPDSPYLFTTERKGPIAAATVRKIILRAGEKTGLEFPCHPHQLRHSCGFYLASQGVDTRAIQQYLGHRSISNTTQYTALSPNRLYGFWTD